MSYYQDSKVFAQLLGEDEKKLHTTKKEANVSRQIDLHETGEASLAPDVIRCTLTCSNVKVSLCFIAFSLVGSFQIISRRTTFI